VFRHQPTFNKALLCAVENGVDGGGEQDNEGEGDESVVGVVYAKWSCVMY
jgi:hypothetical protein